MYVRQELYLSLTVVQPFTSVLYYINIVTPLYHKNIIFINTHEISSFYRGFFF